MFAARLAHQKSWQENLIVFFNTRMKKLLTLLLVIPFFAVAQKKSSGDGSYKVALGLRAGYHPGITLKYMSSSDVALEGIFQFRYHGVVLTGLYEKHAAAFDVERLRWFYGLGGHIGAYERPYYGWGRYKGYYDHDYYRTRPRIGVDGILGLEYIIGEIPFSVSIDWKPYIDIWYYGAGFYDGALSVRYNF